MSSDPFDIQVEKFRKKIIEKLKTDGQPGTDHDEWQASITTLLEELQVASEELRQQNEELYHAQVLLHKESRRYQSLFEAAPNAYLVTDRLGIIKEANQAAIEMLNIPPHRVAGKPLATFLRGSALQEMLTNLRALTLIKSRLEWESQFYPRDKGMMNVRISAALQPDDDSQEPAVLWLIRDVTGYHRMEKQAHAAQERFRVIFESAHIGILLLDSRGRVLQFNQALRDILGLANSDLIDYHYPAVLNLADPTDAYEKFKSLVDGSLDRYEGEYLAHRKNGLELWINVALSPLQDAEAGQQYVLGICEDVTLKHDRELEQIKVERSLEQAIDNERAGLARELHDGPLQYQINLIFDIQQILADTQDPELRKRMEKLRDEARQIVNMLRLTTGFLRSTILSTFGLDSAIQSYIDQVQTSTDTTILTEMRLPEQELTTRLQQGIYRIFQTALINALRHSRASLVMVRLFPDEDGHLVLEIEDNGQGFNVPEHWLDFSQEGHYGLIGSAERAAALGGVLKIHSKPGEGTTIQAKFPLLGAEQKKRHLTDLDLDIPRF